MTKQAPKKIYKVVMRAGKAPKPSMKKPKTLHSRFAAKKVPKKA